VRNVLMLHEEAGLVSLPLEDAVVCSTCATVSTSRFGRCGLCGSETIQSLAELLEGPKDPPPAPGLALPRLALVA
jgi:hypothetical protein